MRVFVTGATGFLGRSLVDRLLDRGCEVTVLVRPSSLERVADRLDTWAARPGARLSVEPGDVTASGVCAGGRGAADFEHVFHVAAIYDLGADADAMTRVNVDGTANVLEWLRSTGFSGTLHHVSSVAVAGDFAGDFGEEHFDEGQSHPHAYHRSKFESERLVREAGDLRWRVYRPSAIVGDSKTGAIDKIDGPYFYFGLVKRMARALPAWFPLATSRGLAINAVPVDFVADAMVALAFSGGADGRVFHLVDPAPPTYQAMYNALSAATNGPSIRITRAARMARKMLGGSGLGELASVRFFQESMLADRGIPVSVLDAMNDEVRYTCAATTKALEGTGVSCPRFVDYAEVLWDYWARHLDPDRRPEDCARAALSGRRVLITGGSSGIGAGLAARCASLGAHVIVSARREEELAGVVVGIRERGGSADYVVADLSDEDSIDALARTVLERWGAPDVLVNNAGRSIRRPLVESASRLHDFERVMKLNYFGAVRLTLAFVEAWKSAGFGQVVNILSAGTPIRPPMFGQYQASKAALEAFGDTLAAEHAHDGIVVSHVYMPLVKTPMVTATDAYEGAGMWDVERAVEFTLDGIVRRERRVFDDHTARRAVLQVIAPRFMTRTLNLLYRMTPDLAERYPELEVDRVVLARLFGSVRI